MPSPSAPTRRARARAAVDAAIADVAAHRGEVFALSRRSAATRINRAAGGARGGDRRRDARAAALRRPRVTRYARGLLRHHVRRAAPRVGFQARAAARSRRARARRRCARSSAGATSSGTATSIRLPRAGMEIDFGGIGKEYAADRAATILRSTGIAHGARQSGRRRARDRPAGGRHALARRHPASARAGAAAIASASISPTARSRRAATTSASSSSTASATATSSMPRTGMPVAHWQSISVVAPLCVVAGSCATIAMLLEGGTRRVPRSAGRRVARRRRARDECAGNAADAIKSARRGGGRGGRKSLVGGKRFSASEARRR